MSDAPSPPDLSLLLFEIADAWRAMEHGRTGIQPDVDPVRESEGGRRARVCGTVHPVGRNSDQHALTGQLGLLEVYG